MHLRSRQTHHVEANGHTRFLIGSKDYPGTWRRSVLRHAPYCIEFQSTNGEVEVWVVPCSLAHRADAGAELARMTGGVRLWPNAARSGGHVHWEPRADLTLADLWKKGDVGKVMRFHKKSSAQK